FQNQNAHVAVIGLGYVGLPLAVNFAQAGYQVTGIDLDTRKVDAINRGESYIEDIPSSTVQALATAEVAYPSVASGSPAEAATTLDGQIRPMPLSAATATRQLSATTDFSILAECDAVSICVPTPLNKTGDPDVSFIVAATDEIAKYLHKGMVVVL